MATTQVHLPRLLISCPLTVSIALSLGRGPLFAPRFGPTIPSRLCHVQVRLSLVVQRRVVVPLYSAPVFMPSTASFLGALVSYAIVCQ